MFTDQETALLSTIQKMLDPNNQIRQEAENNIKTWAKQTYPEILQACTKFITCENLQQDVRQYSCFLMGFLFKEENYENWSKISIETKKQIQNSTLSILGNPLRPLRQAACSVVASLEKISLKKNEWPDLIPILCNACDSPENEFKISAIKTLGMIWEFLKIENISNENFNLMETAIVKILSNSNCNELSIEGLKAYKLFLNYIKNKFNDNNYLEPTLKMLTNLSNINNKNLNDDVITIAIHRITEVVKIAYDYMKSHFKYLVEFLCLLCNGQDEKLAIQAYIFFIEFTEYENLLFRQKKSKQYIDDIWDILWPTIKNTLNNKNNNLIDNDYNRYKALSPLLYNISQYSSLNIIKDIFDYIIQNLNSKNINLINSAIYSYASILETVYQDDMEDLVIKSIEPLSNYFNPNNKELNNTLSWCYEKMCEVYGSIIISNNTVNTTIFHSVILKNLKNENIDNITKIRLCLALEHLTNALFKNSVARNLGVMNDLPDLLKTLDELAYNEKSYDNNFNECLSRYCFLALGGLLECASEKNMFVINSFLEKLLERFEEAKNPNNFKNKEKYIDFQNNLCRCLSNFSNNSNIKLDFAKAQKFYEIIDYFFKERKCVFEEGLLAIAGLSQGVPNSQFSNLLPQIMNYVFYAIDEYKDFSTCKAALTCLSKLIRSNKNYFEPYIEKLINKFEFLMNQVDANRNIFCFISIIYSDLFISVGELIWKYAPRILNYMNNAITICVQNASQFLNNNDEEGLNYYMNFNNNLMDLFSHILQKVISDTNERKNVFQVYVNNILDYIKFMFSQKNFKPSKDYIMDCIGLLFDLIDIYTEQVATSINEGTLKKISQMAEKCNDEEIMNLMEGLQNQFFLAIYKVDRDNIF